MAGEASSRVHRSPDKDLVGDVACSEIGRALPASHQGNKARMITTLPDDQLVLETDRLELRPLTLHDQDLVERLWGDIRVMKYVTDVIAPEQVAGHMQNGTKRGAGGRIGIWSARRKDTGAQIGTCVLIPVPIDEDDTDWSVVVPEAYPPGQIEVGYLLLPEAWGQGFATEICKGLLRFAFELTELAEVVATTDPENKASQNVLQKCGLRSLGRKRAYAYDYVAWFEITKVDWNSIA